MDGCGTGTLCGTGAGAAGWEAGGAAGLGTDDLTGFMVKAFGLTGVLNGVETGLGCC